jgi:FixJ family two-component response regulator
MTAGVQTVVVIEDDSGMRAALGRVLVAAGFRVEAFESAEAFFTADAAKHADCLICDIRLPGISGIELRRRLTLVHSTTPFVFITSHDCAQTREAAQRLGAASYLTKPFEGHELVDIVRQATHSS